MYLVETESGNSYVVKAQKPNKHVDFIPAMNAISDLHFHYHLEYVVAPVESFHRKNIVKFDDNWISLFPYIKGESLYELDDFTSNLAQIAKMTAEFHHVNIEPFDMLPRETFENPFEATILKLLHLAKSQVNSSNHYKLKVSSLLLNQKKDINATLAKMRNMQKKLSDVSTDVAITHGDINFENILRDTEDNLHIIDWGEVGIAPVERDMMFFIEVDGEPLDFKRFLSSYLMNRPETTIHPEIFEFYLYRWCLQEIADFGDRILLETTQEEEMKHSWEELQPYLPIPHHSIQEKIRGITRALSSL